jgi:hypothetical protein
MRVGAAADCGHLFADNCLDVLNRPLALGCLWLVSSWWTTLVCGGWYLHTCTVLSDSLFGLV